MSIVIADTAGQSTDARVLELQNLQREYRRMEIDRRAYAEQSQAILRKQQITIDKFKQDNETLKHDLAMVMRASNRPMTTNQQESVQAITDLGDKYASAIEYERLNIQTMEEQIQILRQKSLQQRRAMGGVNASKENHYMIQKQIKILENRLDKSLIKFNEAVSHNKTLRERIDDLRRERVVFENIYRKMERELQEKKRQMAQIIEQSNQAYEQRDAFQMEVAAIEQANRKEQEDFDEQMTTLAHILDVDLQLPSIGASLGQRAKSLTKLSKSQLLSPLRSPSTDLLRTKSAGGGIGFGGKGIDHLHMSGGAGGGDSSNHSTSTAEAPGTPAVREIDYRERVQNFEEAFNKIKAATGISDINNLVSIFIKNEEHNFSLFNYVNEQNNEIEKLEEQILALKEEENKYKLENGQDVSQHKEILKDLENKLQYTDTMAEKYELKCQDLSRIIETLKRGMQSIVSKVEVYGDGHMELSHASAAGAGPNLSSTSPAGEDVDQMASPSANLASSAAAANANPSAYTPPVITEVNMVNYLGILENKALQLLQQYNNLRAVMMGTHSDLADMAKPPLEHTSTPVALPTAANLTNQTLVSVLGSGPKVPMGTEHIHINPPKAEDYRSDDDSDDGNANIYDEEDTRPFTREELKFRTLNKLQKKLGMSLHNISSNMAAGAVADGSTKKKAGKK